MNLILYGPPGSGKTTVGRALADRLGREFADMDQVLAAQVGMTIPDLFVALGEPVFREWESTVCRILASRDNLVIACGGGALSKDENRATLEASGPVICLECAPDEILRRLSGNGARPLLSGSDPAGRLVQLLESRRSVYESFAWRVDTTGKTVTEVVDAIVSSFAGSAAPNRRRQYRFHVESSIAHEIRAGRGLLGTVRDALQAQGIQVPKVVVTDTNVTLLHGERAAASMGAKLVAIPAGETHKTLETVRALYDAFLDAGVERGSTIAALGGGVVGDIAGFAAATFMRGVPWVNLPTTLLAMVDASIGGKVGVDLPQGKNLVGAFHLPALVVADLDALGTLPEAEFRAGMAEVVKAAMIGDAELFRRLESGVESLEEIITRAIAVKVSVVRADPYEDTGERAKLNLGHTIGHGIEVASGYTLRHGEAVAIGLVAETRLAERMGLADGRLPDRLVAVLQRLGLPIRAGGLAPTAIRAAMNTDKKKQHNRLKFALPRRIGEVISGIEVDETLLSEVLREITHDR